VIVVLFLKIFNPFLLRHYRTRSTKENMGAGKNGLGKNGPGKKGPGKNGPEKTVR